MKSEPLYFNNTVLRDGHQSLAATRMALSQMLPAAPLLDSMGFHGLETWGGAVIDSCLRYLGENPFDRLRALKKAAPTTPHIMLLRGQNLVQYTSFPDDVVESFVACSAKAGMDVFRIFDALNDMRNMETAIRAVIREGKHARGEICYTISPLHTLDAFVEMGVQFEKLGCHSLGIKDMAGIMRPAVAKELVMRLKKATRLPVTLHSHDTAGLAAASYMAAVDAGVDVVETSITPFANGTSQPDTLRMLDLLNGHPRCPEFDCGKLAELREHFEAVYRQLSAYTNPANERVDADTLQYQVPGGMLSNFRNQLKEQGMADRLPEVMQEINVVREALGWIPLVTPTSQIAGTQAMLNVKFGRWKMLSQPAMDILLGKYGKTPGPVDAELQAEAARKCSQPVIECRPADLLKPGMPVLREALRAKGLPDTDEYAVLWAMFPQELAKQHTASQAKVSVPSIPPIETKGRGVVESVTQAEVVSSKKYRLEINGCCSEVLVEDLA